MTTTPNTPNGPTPEEIAEAIEMLRRELTQNADAIAAIDDTEEDVTS